MSSLSDNITSIATLTTAIALLISTLLNARRIKSVDSKIESVHEEVKTGNSLTLAQLADNIETRRIDSIKPRNRTRLEKTHIQEVGDSVAKNN